jgi:hypothetical protein
MKRKVVKIFPKKIKTKNEADFMEGFYALTVATVAVKCKQFVTR